MRQVWSFLPESEATLAIDNCGACRVKDPLVVEERGYGVGRFPVEVASNDGACTLFVGFGGVEERA